MIKVCSFHNRIGTASDFALISGVVKTYRLTYEAVEVMHALFDKSIANNHWSMKSTYLKEFIEYFGPRTEQLDFFFEPNQVTFTSFTEKIVNANKGVSITAWFVSSVTNTSTEILKQPLHTAVTINASDFDEIEAQSQLHVKINVKDFRAIVAHAVTLNCQFKAHFSRPGRPLQFQYDAFGMDCSFTLMTVSDGRAAPAPAAAPVHRIQTRVVKPAEPSPTIQETTQGRRESNKMPPPPVPSSRRPLGRNKPAGLAPASQTAARQDIDPESLFIPRDDDQEWDPQTIDEGEALQWDASANNVRPC